MSAPQMKERPASMLRSMFAGLGSLLNVVDKMRSKPARQATPAKPETKAAKVAAAPEATLAAAPEAPSAAAPEATRETLAEDIVEPEIVLVETDIVLVETDPVTGEPEVVVVEADSVALPLVNYDELSVASLRARLRNLSVDQLGELLGYEQAHAARPDVISMFERRIAKVQAES